MRKKLLLILLGFSLVFTASVSAQLFRRNDDNDRNRGYTLTVRCNVSADVYIDGKRVGKTGEDIIVSPGNHKIKVTTRGYSEYEANVLVKRNMEIRVNLEGRTAKITLVIPKENLSEARNPLRQIILIVDGVVQRGHTVEVDEGSHEIGIGSGGLVFYQRVNIRAGRNYTIRPDFNIRVND